MKKILCSLILGLATGAMASQFPPAFELNTVNATLLSASTNAVGSPLFAEQCKYHTFVIVNAAAGTNIVTISGSLDSTNMIPLYAVTNTGIATTSFSYVGKWSYLQASAAIASTNTTSLNVTVEYLGGN